jgi:hypothetical protein
MKTKILFCLLVAVVILGGCAGPVQYVTTERKGPDNQTESITTRGNFWSGEPMERLHHSALLGRVPGEQTHINIHTSNYNSGDNSFGNGPLIRVPRVPPNQWSPTQRAAMAAEEKYRGK